MSDADVKKKILIVEDEEDLAEPLQVKLEIQGFDVLWRDSGEEGLKTALAEHPDLTFLDVTLTQMTGLEVIQKIREDSWGKSATIFLLTNHDDERSIAIAKEYGCDKYLIKSNQSLDEIVSMVKEQLS